MEFHDAGRAGKLVLQTCLLPDREEPYVLSLAGYLVTVTARLASVRALSKYYIAKRKPKRV